MGYLLATTFTLLAGYWVAAEAQDATTPKRHALRDAGVSLWEKGCPKPIEVERKPVRNIHDPTVVDVVVKFACPSLEIGIYQAQVSTPATDLLGSVTLTGRRHKLPFGIRIGVPKSSIEKVLGQPDGKEGEAIYYHLHNEGPGSDALYFFLKNDRVQKIEWVFFIE